MQKVADLTRIVMGTVGSLKVDRLTILGGIGGGDGGAGPGGASADLTGKLIAASEQIKAATGIDLAAVLRARTSGNPPPNPPLTGAMEGLRRSSGGEVPMTPKGRV